MRLIQVLVVVTCLYSGNGVKVVSLQTDVWAAPRVDVFLRGRLQGQRRRGNQQDSPTLPVTDALTVCYRFRNSAFSQEETHLSYAIPGVPNYLLAYRFGPQFRILLNNTRVEGLDEYVTRMQLGVWTHYCLLLTPGMVHLYVDGTFQVKASHTMPLEELDLTGVLVLGQEQDELGGGFVVGEMFLGSLAQMDIWSSALSDDDVRQLAKCGAELHGDVFSLDLDLEEMENSNVEVTSVELGDLCSELDIKTVIHSVSLNFLEAIEFCGKTGALLLAPSSCAAASLFYNQSLEFADFCQDSFWVGVTDAAQEGVWRAAGSGELATTCFTLDPNGAEAENCVSIRLENGAWDDRSCQQPPRCFACEAVTDVRAGQPRPLVLRGLCFKTPERRFFEVLGYINDRPFFHGYYGLNIYATEDDWWELLDTRTNRTLARGYPPWDIGYPVGRMAWTTTTKFCNFRKNEEIELSLTVCNASEIACSDGSCVREAARCDGRYQCPDLSDEDDCALVAFPSGYRLQIPPEPRVPGSPQHINVSVSFLRFLSIEDTKYSITVEFMLDTAWRDGRLNFNNLRRDADDNKASVAEQERLWRPSIKFTNVLDGNVRVLERGLRVAKTGTSIPRGFNEVGGDTVYEGWSGVLIDSQHVSGTFDCTFHLYQYPFDSQRCSVKMRFGRDLGNQLVVEDGDAEVQYLGAAILPSHRLHNFTIKRVDGQQGITLAVFFNLERRPRVLVIKLFIPSLMLVSVGYVTLYIPRKLLQARLIVSLTTKLVLYTLFNQASSTLPITAYIKLIDIWFFFCICTLLSIILVHVLVEHLPEETGQGGKVVQIPSSAAAVRIVNAAGGAEGGKKDNLNFSLRTHRAGIWCLTADRALKIMRYCIVPIATTIFLAFYWIAIMGN